MHRVRFCIPLLLLLLAACGEETGPAVAAPQAGSGLSEHTPGDSIPPDSLYGATPVENLRVTNVELDVLDLPGGWDGLRIAAISDLQLGLWDGNEQVAAAAVRRAVGSGADLVVLLGDYLASGQDTAALARVLAPLRGRQVLAVLGDRDVRSDSVQAQVTRTLDRLGIRVLDNDAAPVTRNGSTALVAGVNPDLATRPWADQEWVLATVGGSGRIPVLLTHVPQLAARAPDGRFGAMLAGNTFCGQVEVPGSPRLAWLRTEALPGAAIPEVERLFRVEGGTLFVTCGVGYGFVPVRLGYPPEVALITLRRVGPPVEQMQPDSAALDTLLRSYQRSDTTTTVPPS